MPVRSLRSSILKWPDRATVHEAVARWAAGLARGFPELEAVGYFGSYARGDWGVGSDVDVVVIVAATSEPFHRRSVRYDATSLPVPADVLVYTQEEWRGLETSGRFRAPRDEMEWVL